MTNVSELKRSVHAFELRIRHVVTETIFVRCENTKYVQIESLIERIVT